ncbi:DNA internalization-related competence protein ComEC/Rec2 [Marinimicrobium sp. ARAG 43.8]|uniref:DNA internalization-related competence protein ComEC/Rec2 n=1 Tax=Marinimicrobium sp. ARAG 43.8 TaxID=3418719 RepID=UPI003CEF760E
MKAKGIEKARLLPRYRWFERNAASGANIRLRTTAMAMATGMASVAFLPSLPPAWSFLPLLFIAALLARHAFLRRMLLAFSLGFGWALLASHEHLLHRLPEDLSGHDIVIEGRLIGLPDQNERRIRSLLAVSAVTDTSGQPLALPLRRVRLSWYGGSGWHAGEEWRLKVRVKAPRGFVNPAGFDYALWLMRQKVDATGYVREGPENRRLSEPSYGSISHWRERARHWLRERAPPDLLGWMQALLIGDRSALAAEDWSLLQSTGTHHLMAISGLHIGFVAWVGFLWGTGIGRLALLLGVRWPASCLAHPLALVFALGYSALAGFSIPTQRALIMVLVVQWAWYRRRTLFPWNAWWVALVLVLMLDPLAVLDSGFWLSFLAVAVLLFTLSGRVSTGVEPTGRWPGWVLWRSQWVVFLGLLIPLWLLVGSATLLSPVANLLAVPWVTFLVVPWLLLAASLAGVAPVLSDATLAVAIWALGWLDTWLLWLDRWRDLVMLRPYLTPTATLMALAGTLLVLLPRGLPGRYLGYLCVPVALSLPPPAVPPLRVVFLEVGQGLAVAVQTPDHTLVYDTGPRYSESLEAGGAILAPYWRQVGVSELDRVVISHAHDDHAGGLHGLLDEIPARSLVRGDSETGMSDCHHTAPWQWNQVRFRFLHNGFPASPNRNNRSCVLLIDYSGQTLLLTGDIEREVEWRLLGDGLLPERITVLQVPHHGANTSSSDAFVTRLRPEHALVSAAYKGRHGHPKAEVLKRYRRVRARVHNTAFDGAVQFEWDERGRLTITRHRIDSHRWWY